MTSFCEKSSHDVMLQEGSHQLNRSGGLTFREVSFRYVTLSWWSLLVLNGWFCWVFVAALSHSYFIVDSIDDTNCALMRWFRLPYWWQMATFESIQSVYHQNWMQIVDLIRSCSNWWTHFLLIIGGFLVDFERGSSRIDHWWIDPDRSIAKKECG